MKIIKAVDYRKKGNHAYLAALTLKGGEIAERDFYNPSSFADNRHYAGRSCDCEFDLEKLKFPDGYAHCRDGNHASAHQDDRYFLIKDKEVIKEFASLEEMLLDAFPAPDLPALEGTSRQISWAESIRSKCAMKNVDADYSNVSAKYWIDNYK